MFWKVMVMFIKADQECFTGLRYVLFESEDVLINVIHYHYVGSSNLRCSFSGTSYYNNNIYLLQLGCYLVAVVILHVNKT